MDIVSYVLLATLLLAAFILLFRILFMHRKEKANSNVLAEGFSNFYGYSTKGMKQIRGNGLLTLSEAFIQFEMYFPRRKVTIPVNQIREVKITFEHVGKLSLSLLCISYVANGHVETVAWKVADTDKWIKAINHVRGNSS